jgi:hypothetical protein
MPDFDLIIRGGKVVFPRPKIAPFGDGSLEHVVWDELSGIEIVDIAICDRKIAAIEPGLRGSTHEMPPICTFFRV